jgi:prolyl-tRNA synthetase
VNHEFMAVAAVGEDNFVWCRSCDYAANVEAAVRQSPDPRPAGAAASDANGSPIEAMAPEHTPDLPGIKGVSEFLGVQPNEMLKCIAFDVDGEMGLALVPGDREVNPFALNRALAGRKVRLWEDADFDAHPDVPKGYIGPHFPGATVLVADPAVGVPSATGWVTGANRVDHHVRRAVLGRDFEVHQYADLVTVVTGDPCPRCGSPLSVDRGIEVGHTFQLGTKYSVALDADYTDENGQQHPMVMGCYGIGVSRVVAAVVEEHHDEHGLAWPAALAPYQVHLVSLPGKGEAAPEVRAAADRLYDELRAAGVDVLYDDRDQSPGVKFADADLLGVPTQLILGAKGLARAVVERKDRRSGERDEVALDAVVGVMSGG